MLYKAHAIASYIDKIRYHAVRIGIDTFPFETVYIEALSKFWWDKTGASFKVQHLGLAIHSRNLYCDESDITWRG